MRCAPSGRLSPVSEDAHAVLVFCNQETDRPEQPGRPPPGSEALHAGEGASVGVVCPREGQK